MLPRPEVLVRLLYGGSGWLDVVDVIRRRLGPEHTVDVWDRSRPLADVVRGYDVLLPSNAHVGADVVREVKLVQQPAAGYDGIDLAAAREAGVPVCNAPGANAEAVAEAALYLLLACARRAGAARRAFADARIGTPMGVELRGRRLVVVGGGRTGGRLADVAGALGMDVAVLRSTSSRGDLLTALSTADAVSLHCPLTPATRGMLDDEAFAALKDGAMLVNVARGPIVDRGALERALDAGKLGGVGLDVFWKEPWDPTEPLWTRPEVVVMPHTAGSTFESFDGIARIVAENVRRSQAGEELLHRVP